MPRENAPRSSLGDVGQSYFTQYLVDSGVPDGVACRQRDQNAPVRSDRGETLWTPASSQLRAEASAGHGSVARRSASPQRRACPNPRIRRIVVDLPDPFGPRKPVTLPGWTVNVSPSTAVVVPYRFTKPSATIICRSLSRLPVRFPRQTLGNQCRRDNNAATTRLLIGGITPFGCWVALRAAHKVLHVSTHHRCSEDHFDLGSLKARIARVRPGDRAGPNFGRPQVGGLRKSRVVYCECRVATVTRQ